MASILKAQSSSSAKGKGKRRHDDVDEDHKMVEVGEAPVKKLRNKQRVLLLSSRGVTLRMRHLMNDLEVLLPHVKKGELVGTSVQLLGTNSSA